MKVDLGRFNNSWYKPGSFVKRSLWYCVSSIFFLNNFMIPTPMFLKRFLLRLFGGKIGVNVIIMPRVNIKYPWFLEIGDNTWIGEGVWLQSLAPINIGNNVCLSQFSNIITGNHDFNKETFDLILQDVCLHDGVWIGARSVVCPGVICEENSVLAVGSVATKNLKKNAIYQGNPAMFKIERC